MAKGKRLRMEVDAGMGKMHWASGWSLGRRGLKAEVSRGQGSGLTDHED